MKRIQKWFKTFSARKVHPKSRSWWKIALWVIGIGFGLGIFCVLAVLAWIWPQLPSLTNLEDMVASQSSVITDREGNVLYRIHGDENRKVVSFNEISPNMTAAILAIEDDQFYNHPGVDVPGLMKAVCAEIGVCSQARGGSTITQQFIKNAFLTNERTYERKLKEIILSFQLEREYTKDEILALYLNRIGYVSNIYGVELASEALFGIPASELSVAQSAVLASLPKSPSYYSPYGSNRYSQIINISEEEILENDLYTEQDLVEINDDKLIQFGLLPKSYTFGEGEQARAIYVSGRTNAVVKRMKELGYITQDEYDQALEELATMEFETLKQDIKAPHFVFYVIQTLEEKYGAEQLSKGGLTITTSLDPQMQRYAEEAIANQAETNLNAYGANNAALVSVDPDTGEIYAMVGSVDYNNEEIDGQVNVATANRSPGSSFKPIAYSAAFLKGYAPSTVVYDVKTSFAGWYTPQNADGSFRGPVTFRNALGASLNIPAIKAGYLAGIPNVLELARKMGLELPLSDADYGLSISLGAGEASPLSMAGAYSIFANGGYKVEPVSVLKITNRDGNILQEHQLDRDQAKDKQDLILDPQVAYLINDILSDRSARPTAGWREQLTIPGQINGAKTGTSNKKENGVNRAQDGWTIGYTRHLVTAVWTGNTDGSGMNFSAYGLNMAAPIWKNFMIKATEGMEQTPFEKPEGIKYVEVDRATGRIPGENTSSSGQVNEVFASFSLLTEKDESYRVIRVVKADGKLPNEFTPPEATEERAFRVHKAIIDNEHWQRGVDAWAKAAGVFGGFPTEVTDLYGPDTVQSAPTIQIAAPAPNATVAPPAVTVQANVGGDRSIKQVDYYWNGSLVGSATSAPYSLRITIPESAAPGSTHTIKAVALNDLYLSAQSSISIQIGSDTSGPNLSFAYPGGSVAQNSSVTIQANASDDNGSVKGVTASVNGQNLGEVTQPPYNWNWQPSEAGEYTLTLSATDYAGNANSVSQTVSVTSQAGSAADGSSATVSAPGSAGSFSSVPVTISLSAEDAAGLKSIDILAKSADSVRGNSVASAGSNGAQSYTLIWGGGQAGTYEVYAKLTMSNGTTRFTQRRTVVVE